MNSVSGQRRKRKRNIRRSGRHVTPSAAEKVALKAGKAAPALAVVGVLAAAPHPHAHQATQPHHAAATQRVVRASLDAVVGSAQPNCPASPAGQACAGHSRHQVHRPAWGHLVRDCLAVLWPSRRLGLAVSGEPVDDQRPKSDLPWSGTHQPAKPHGLPYRRHGHGRGQRRARRREPTAALAGQSGGR